MELSELCMWLCLFGGMWTVYDVYTVNNELQEITAGMQSCSTAQVWPDVVKKLVVSLDEDPAFKTAVIRGAVSAIEKGARNVSKDMIVEGFVGLGHTFLPQNGAEMLRLLSIANYSKTATVISQFAQRMSMASALNADDVYLYRTGYLTDFFAIVSQVANIVANTPYITADPIQSDGSAVGNFLAEIQPQLEETLGNQDVIKKASQDCVDLAMRVYSTDWRGCAHQGYCFEVSNEVQARVSYVIDFCRLMEASTRY